MTLKQIHTSQKPVVYFNLRKSSRERMWDTAREAARVCEPLVPDLSQQTSISRNASYKNTRTARVRKLKQMVKTWLPLINHQSVEAPDEADILYMWGAFPKNSNKPFILELDNPFVLTYYNQWAFRLRKRALKKKLRTAKCVTFMSATARNHALELLGADFADHFKVLPPFMTDNYKDNQRPQDGLVRFLFVGLGFRRKGGPELLEAFSQLSNKNIRLTVISPVDEVTLHKYSADARITFLPPQPREKLFNEYYPTHDIFVFPSLLETLGVVILEALSFGMGIITTDVYATPEMVRDGKNGKLLLHPFLQPVDLNNTPTVDAVSIARKKFDTQYIHGVPPYKNLVSEVTSALEQSVDDYQQWQRESQHMFTKKYAPDVWRQKLQDILTNVT